MKNVGTSQEFTTLTNDAGGYTFSNLVSGTYELTFSASGFRPVTRRGIVITVNTVRREDVGLEIGQVNESVTVQAGGATLQTDKTDVHSELSSKEVINMPLPHYRNYQSLINLTPGATPGRSAELDSSRARAGPRSERERSESKQQLHPHRWRDQRLHMASPAIPRTCRPRRPSTR